MIRSVGVVQSVDLGVVQRIDLKDQVYGLVKARLLTRELGPVTKLGLQDLADELGVSRSPVQHALTRLVTEGLVEVDKTGYRVRPITARLMDEAHDVRCALELFAAEQTVGKLTRPHLRELRELHERAVEQVENRSFLDKHGYMLANKALHEYLVDLAGNETLSDTYRSLRVHELMETAFARQTGDAGDTNEDHLRIVEAYEAGDLASARTAIIANVETGKRLVLTMIEAAGGRI